MIVASPVFMNFDGIGPFAGKVSKDDANKKTPV